MSMEIGLQMDMLQAERALGTYGRQLPFATARAINATAKDFQRFQRNHMANVFTVRRPTFVNRSVKIKPFATKARLAATVTIDPPGGQARADILAKFERGGRKAPRHGRHVAVPIEARRTARGIVSRGQRPKAFGFRRRGRRIEGAKRTFIVPGVGIMQRVGRRGRSRVRLLYSFKRSVPIPPDLRFVEHATQTIERRFDKNFRVALRRAIRTAR